MKKLEVFFAVVIFSITMNILIAQTPRSWILPDPNYPYKAIFNQSGTYLEQLFNTEYIVGSESKLFSSGSFDEDESLYFYIIGNQLINYVDGTDVGNFTNGEITDLTTLSAELEIIRAPGSELNKYFVFYARKISDTEGFCYTEVTYANSTTTIVDRKHFDYTGFGYGAFSIGEEREEFGNIVRDIYYCCGEVNYGLRKRNINNNGVGTELTTLVDSSDPVFDSDEVFKAYNMEMIKNHSGDVLLAWIVRDDDYKSNLFMYNEDSGDAYNFDINQGRINGMEFSQLNENIIYISCDESLNPGIYAYNFSDENSQFLTGSENYCRTSLEASKDGYIYAVSNDGLSLGRIDESSSVFEPNVLNGFGELVTYITLNSLHYYILPEYSDYPFFFDLEVDFSYLECPGDCNGYATAIPTNGEIDDFTWVWKDENQNIISSTNVASELCEGEYTVEATHSGKTVSKTVNIGLDPDLWDYPEVFELTSSTEWDGETFGFLKGLTIKPGVTLELSNNTNLLFGTDAKLIIERGAMLIVDNSSLKNPDDCPDMWAGIEVWGDPTMPSDVHYQGTVLMMNNGIIANADVGIRTVKVEESGGQKVNNLEFAGGIVRAVDAVFLNNLEAVQWFKYPATGYNHEYSGFINTSLFETNEDYFGSLNPDYFIKISELNKVSFAGCEFINNTGQQYFQSGIYSYNSRFFVDGYMQGGSQQYSVFDDLLHGIYAICSNPNRYADIRYTNFVRNFKGLYISGMTSAWVTSNIFNTDAPFSPLGGYGMYLNASTGYWVEDNDFLHEGTGKVGVGLIVCNSGTLPNEIYRNRFTNLALGISAQELNCSVMEPAVGLQILCNDFDICLADVLVPRPRNLSWGIAPNQGNDGTEPTDMAGNLFYINPEPIVDYDDIKNQGRHVTYYYPSNYAFGYQRVKPVDYTQNTVTLEETEVSENWTPENGCPPVIEGGGGGGKSSSELLEDIGKAQQEIDSTQSLLAMLIDGGSTENLQEEVEYSFPPEAMAIYTELIDNSPYLSDTVVSTAIEKEEVLPGAMLRDVMVANPHTAKNDELMNKLDERWTPLPEYMKEQILQGKDIVSVMEKTESKLAKFRMDKERAINELSRIYRNDTMAGVDSLTALYIADHDLESKYKLAFLSMEQGAWSTGLNTLTWTSQNQRGKKINFTGWN